MFVLVWMVLGAIACLVVPFGPVIVIGIMLGLVVDNYRNTLYLREDIRAIKNHMGLMNSKESEEYKLDNEFNQMDQLTSDEMSVINKRIEAELAKESKKNKN